LLLNITNNLFEPDAAAQHKLLQTSEVKECLSLGVCMQRELNLQKLRAVNYLHTKELVTIVLDTSVERLSTMEELQYEYYMFSLSKFVFCRDHKR
jgi:hypothetical protein